MSEQCFFLAIIAPICSLSRPFAGRVKDLFVLGVEFAGFELTAAPVANMFH